MGWVVGLICTAIGVILFLDPCWILKTSLGVLVYGLTQLFQTVPKPRRANILALGGLMDIFSVSSRRVRLECDLSNDRKCGHKGMLWLCIEIWLLFVSIEKLFNSSWLSLIILILVTASEGWVFVFKHLLTTLVWNHPYTSQAGLFERNRFLERLGDSLNLDWGLP